MGVITAAPAVAISVLILPLYDTLRVFSIRIWQGRSPFRADRQHLHHKLIDLGLSHKKATFILVACNHLFVLFSLFMQDVGSIPLTLMMLIIATLMSTALDRMAADHVTKQRELEALLAEYLIKLYRPEVHEFGRAGKGQERKIVRRIRESAFISN
jgi:hypothetical protein